MRMLSRVGQSALTAGALAMMHIRSALAQFAGPTPDIPGTPGEGGSPEDIRIIITNVLATVLNFLALIAVVVVVIAGIRLILSQGEEEQKEKAKKTIFYALIGLVIVLFARVIVGLVTNFLAQQVAD